MEHYKQKIFVGKSNAEALLEHRNFLQTIIDNVNDGLMVINRDYTIAYANKAALDMHGNQLVEPAMTCYQLSHAQNVPCTGIDHVCPLKAVMQSKMPEHVKHIHRDRDGRKRSIEISCSPILDKNGEVTQVIELFRDVTEREQREQLRDTQVRLSELSIKYTSKELLQAFVDEAEKITNSKIGFLLLIDEEHSLIKFQVWSTNTVNNMCSTREDIGHSPMKKAGIWADCLRKRRIVIHNDYESVEYKKGLPEGHIPIVRELVVPVFRNDQIVAVLGVGNREFDYDDKDGEILTTLAHMAWNIISHKQIKEDLQSSEARFSKMFFSSPDATVLVRLSNGTIIDINVAFERIFGYTRQFCIDKTIQELELWSDNGRHKSILKGLYSGNTVQGLEIVCQRSSGYKFDASISCDMTTIEQEAHLIIIIRDISQRKAADQEKKALEKQLQQSRKMESIGTLAGGIAHDFNNILSAIMGYTQLVMKSLPDTSENHKRLDNVLTASQRASDLVAQILTFSRNDVQDLKPLRIQLIITMVRTNSGVNNAIVY